MRWRLLHTPPMSGVDNMSLDEALLARARRTGEGVVRVYGWAEPTLSLGRNQYAREVYPADRARTLGVAVVRRATGGRALLHHREITYAVAAPAKPQESLQHSYRAINRALLETLRALGAFAEIAVAPGRLPPPGSAPCFERPADGELMYSGRKLVGSAQYREQGAFLQHGSVLVHDDQLMVRELAVVPIPSVSPAATLAEALGREPLAQEFADALFAVVRRRWDGAAESLEVDEHLHSAVEVARVRYASDAWTWRR